MIKTTVPSRKLLQWKELWFKGPKLREHSRIAKKINKHFLDSMFRKMLNHSIFQPKLFHLVFDFGHFKNYRAAYSTSAGNVIRWRQQLLSQHKSTEICRIILATSLFKKYLLCCVNKMSTKWKQSLFLKPRGHSLQNWNLFLTSKKTKKVELIFFKRFRYSIFLKIKEIFDDIF